ncbi:growth hormone-inducible transmembrane protein isoform X2 [Dendroctonus ponderosae]|uniref:Growth hormone-inducible transmembrane protein n=1 Tax=Dendroctonus ponderosae TaxID=77166 RepID=J3JYE3_DENPD|nr:growth hormone-inducible transmembrane protein isoform X2 [Dendroctonus ponderosae]AEE63229.1 unknown [Dendroctonus ponderosae]
MSLMLASRLCRAPVFQRSLINQLPSRAVARTYANEGRDAVAREARRKATLKERAMAPSSGTAFNIGKGAVAGGSVLGIGALCYYGLSSGSGASALEQSHMWPQYVRDRIKSTYFYFGSSIAVTAASAAAAFRSPAIMNIVARNGFVGIAISLVAIIGTGMLAQSLEYSPGFGPKQMAWLLHAGVMGAMVAPLCFLGGPILIRAAWYTAGVVGGLSTIAVCAPNDTFLYMGGPLAMGLGVVFCSSIGSMFLPPTTALGAGLYSISLYGGLLLFSAFLLYDTQRIVVQAERYPAQPEYQGVKPYDPINNAISIYLDTLNLFIRIAMMLGMGERSK